MIPRPPIQDINDLQNNRVFGQSSIFVASVNPAPVQTDMDSNAASRRLMPADRNGRHPRKLTNIHTMAVIAMDKLLRVDLLPSVRRRKEVPRRRNKNVVCPIMERGSHS
jgi:hypothetical protein